VKTSNIEQLAFFYKAILDIVSVLFYRAEFNRSFPSKGCSFNLTNIVSLSPES